MKKKKRKVKLHPASMVGHRKNRKTAVAPKSAITVLCVFSDPVCWKSLCTGILAVI